MAIEPEKRMPPYIPYATFDNFINGLSESSVPKKIDGSLLRNLSGSARSGLMVTLRYLGLIDENGITKPALEELVLATGEARKPILQSLITGAYTFLPDLDLKRATPAMLAEAIGNEGAGGGTRDKAVGFFLKAAEAAGVEVSPHILKRKHTVSTVRRIKRTPKNPKPGQSDLQTPPQHNPSQAQHAKHRSPYEVLMHDIYDPKTMGPGSEEEKAVFTLVRYLKSRESGS